MLSKRQYQKTYKSKHWFERILYCIFQRFNCIRGTNSSTKQYLCKKWLLISSSVKLSMSSLRLPAQCVEKDGKIKMVIWGRSEYTVNVVSQLRNKYVSVKLILLYFSLVPIGEQQLERGKYLHFASYCVPDRLRNKGGQRRTKVSYSQPRVK